MKKGEALQQVCAALHALGGHYRGDDPQEAADALNKLLQRREGKPPCWGRSFNHMEWTCRRCDLYDDCMKSTTLARVSLADPFPEGGECDECDGLLTVDLFDDDGRIVDRGCSTAGCLNTAARQSAK